MKKSAIVVILLGLILCGVLAWTFWLRGSQHLPATPISPALNVALPTPKNPPAAPPLAEVPASLKSVADIDAKSEASQAQYDPVLAKIRGEIEDLKTPFQNPAFGEVPPDFKFKLQPAEGMKASGRMIQYRADENGKPITDKNTVIWDLGHFTTTIEGDSGKGTFFQHIQFEKPYQYHYSDHQVSEKEANRFSVEWTSAGVAKEPDSRPVSGDWTGPNDPAGPVRLCDGEWLTDKTFAKGATFKTSEHNTMRGGASETSCEVLGATTIKGHELVAFELKDSGSDTEFRLKDIGPVRWERVRRVYMDAKTSMPFRIEYKTAYCYTPEQMANPEVQRFELACGGMPASGRKETHFLYQIDP